MFKIGNKTIKIIPESTVLKIALLAAAVAEVLFIVLVLVLDVLPFGYIAGIIIALLIIDALILLLTNGRTSKHTKSIAALVIIMFMLNVLTIGDCYVYSTYDTLQKISAQRATWENYNVVTLRGGSYDEIGDIKGQTVNVVDMESKQLNEAMERLVTKEDVTFEQVNGLITLGQTIVGEPSKVKDSEVTGADTGDVTEEDIAKAAEEQAEEEKTTTNTEPVIKDSDAVVEAEDSGLHDEIILVSNSGYKLMKSNIKNFKKNTQVIHKIKVKKRANDTSKAVDVTKDSFNVLISGLDSWGTIDQGGLSDVNMVMTVNPVAGEIMLTSIPRDSYVTLHSYGAKDKLTHTGIYGEDETRKTIEDFLDIDINYTIRVNFSLLQDLINEIGGIEVYSDYEFDSAISKYHYIKGKQLLAGRPALYFARERKAFSDGDMQRNKNQQIVLKAVIKKVTNSRVLIADYTGILNAVEDEMWTDMSNKELRRLAKMQLSTMKKWNVKTVNIRGTTGGAPCFSMGGQNLSCVFPSEESVTKAKEAIHNTMYPAENVTDSTEVTNGQ